MSDLRSYILSDNAENDISEIYDYTESAHGTGQASTYLSGLETTLNMLVDGPNLGKLRPEIRKELRSFIYEKHIIFYRVLSDHIRIVRVLHSRRDIPKYFN